MQRTAFSRRRPLASVVLALASATLLASAASAAPFAANLINLYSFTTASILDLTGASAASGTGTRGDLLLANDGNFYVATSTGGAASVGTVMRITPDGTATVVHAFANTVAESASPYAGLIQASDGNLYGTSYVGGANSQGSVYKVTLAGAYTLVYSFSSASKGGYAPYTGLTQGPDGALYGTTLKGGDNNAGMIFRITLDGTLTTLHSFNGTDGNSPEGTLVVGPDNALYGTTVAGGASDRGTIYKITTTGTFTSLYTFPTLGPINSAGVGTNADGANPRAGLTLGSDGNFYGTAYQGGAGGFGTVFKVTPAGVLTTLHAFGGPPSDGASPLAGVMQSADGSLYGTTEKGGYAGAGVAWRLSVSGSYALLYAFTSLTSDGGSPYTKLLMLNGTVYGVSFTDTVSAGGALFKLDEGTAGVLPISLSVTPESLSLGASATISWSSPTAATCTTSGIWTDVVSTAGTQVVTPSTAGIYPYGLSCTDGAGVIRLAQSVVVVSAPPAQAVDGGTAGGGGALSVLTLGLLGAAVARVARRRILTVVN